MERDIRRERERESEKKQVPICTINLRSNAPLQNLRHEQLIKLSPHEEHSEKASKTPLRISQTPGFPPNGNAMERQAYDRFITRFTTMNPQSYRCSGLAFDSFDWHGQSDAWKRIDQGFEKMVGGCWWLMMINDSNDH